MIELVDWISDPKNVVLLALGGSFIAKIITALFPDGHWVMTLLNVVAGNLGKARNSEQHQGKALDFLRLMK